ncbi:MULTISPECIES: biotin/lipoyl-binding protein [Sphingobacterium]|nr:MULTISPECIES: biotin/lipoyl-binding protein [Sphingobacterium]HAF33929.1 hypothetical protein [Sphingobacterium sp.]HAL51314.1 hypothetical protein [Sphingobacterium sp.]HAU52690.1 hypothetical protein [Sphingobacterium sp.]
MNKNKTDKIVVDLTKWLGITLFVGIIIWAAVYFFEGYRYEQTNDAQIDAYLSPINVKVGGYIRKIYYKDNQQVKKGDTLVVIEQDEYGLKRDAASAELMSAQAKLPVLAASEETQVKSIAVINPEFVAQEKSRRSIRAVEDSIIHRINYADYQYLLGRVTSWNKVIQAVMEREYIQKEQYLLNYNNKSALDKYHHVLSNEPKLIQRIATQDLASYLGITQRSLTRAKGQIHRAKVL